MPPKVFVSLLAVVLLAGAVTATLIAALPAGAVAVLVPFALAAAWMARRGSG
jgi:pilus assembly protein TadC